jgi:hypothetical protein
MSSDPVSFALRTPGHLRFPSTRALADTFGQSGGCVVSRLTGHLVFYRPDGRRFLAADPSGHPLHECEWRSNADGTVSLARARIRLDWGRWIGLKPGGLVNEIRLNLAAKAGWRRITPDDLRAMAAQALRVPIEEVRWFYHDEDLSIDAQGMATIRHKKDAFYVLEDGTFESARFMACMGAMHWDHIDFLPVVELFKSLLPGTGSAVFELIRGLYDDQNEGLRSPRSLRYRGIPTYPSEAAFRLFSNFFSPHAPSGVDSLTLFMDQTRSHEITWTPTPDPPVRHFHTHPPVCLTVQGGQIQKATLADDPMGLAYINPAMRHVIAWDRSVTVREEGLELVDRRERKRVAMSVTRFRPLSQGPVPAPSPVDWRSVFVEGMPSVQAGEVFGAVLLYPEDNTPIGEPAAQPFVSDYLQDLAEQDREIGRIVSRAGKILIDNGDAVITTCIPFDRPREVVAHIRSPAFAIKQAQQVWTVCAELQRWDWLKLTRFKEAKAAEPVGWFPDLAYVWLPYEDFERSAALAAHSRALAARLRPHGDAFVVGPVRFGRDLVQAGLQVCWEEAVERLPTFAMHKTILPKATLRAGLTLFRTRRA